MNSSLRIQDEVEAVYRSVKKAVIERAMEGEMTHHFGYWPGEANPAEQGNDRNGTIGKTGITDDGPVRIEVPRDRASRLASHHCCLAGDSILEANSWVAM